VVATTFKVAWIWQFLIHLFGDIKTQAKTCDYQDFQEPLRNLGLKKGGERMLY
jgi:hypothetical protein